MEEKPKASRLLVAAMREIARALDIARHNVLQEAYNSDTDDPFTSVGGSFEIPGFSVRPFDFDCDAENPPSWNFKRGDIEVFWYKYPFRSLTVNRELSPSDIDALLNECIEAIESWEEASEMEETDD